MKESPRADGFLINKKGEEIKSHAETPSAPKINSNIDPKVEAMNIVSEIEKQKQKATIANTKKRGLGPAETGSLLKHKQLQQSKFSNNRQPTTAPMSNYVDFDSSDSSLGSFEG